VSGRTPAHGVAACELYRPAALGRVPTTSREELAAGRARSRLAAPLHEPFAATTRRLAARSCGSRRARAFRRRCRIAPVATRSGRSAAGSTTCKGEEAGRPPDLPLERFVGDNYGGMSTGGVWRRRRSKQDACDGKND
jgi:hypothetical protein